MEYKPFYDEFKHRKPSKHHQMTTFFLITPSQNATKYLTFVAIKTKQKQKKIIYKLFL